MLHYGSGGIPDDIFREIVANGFGNLFRWQNEPGGSNTQSVEEWYEQHQMLDWAEVRGSGRSPDNQPDRS